MNGLPFLVRTVICVFFLLSALTVNDTNAKVILKETTAYYSVVGKTGREIFKSMIDRGPRLGGPKGHALATTEYKYDINNVDVEIKQGRCIPVRVDVVVRVKYTYPRWAGNRGARKSTRRAWKHFEKSVVWHEKQHVKIALDYAKEYQLALKKTRLRSSQNCTATSFSTTWRATRAALKHNRRQRLFDRQDLRPGGRGYEAQLRLLKAE